MNERIRDLVKQAGGHFSTHNLMSNPVQHRESIELWDKNIEKFAELIVRECAKTIEVYIHESLYNGLYERGYNDGRNASALLIKQHFGVEK